MWLQLFSAGMAQALAHTQGEHDEAFLGALIVAI